MNKIILNARMFVVVCVLMGIAPAHAATNYWINSAGGTFSNAVNWASGTTPATTDILYFTNNASYQVDYIGAPTIVGSEQYYNAGSGVVTNNLTENVGLSGTKILSIGDSLGSTATVVQVGNFSFTETTLDVGNNGVGSLTLNGSGMLPGSGVNVGLNTAGNSLLLTNAAFWNGNALTIGSVAASTNNSVMVTGVGTVMTNNHTVFVGGSGANNTMLIKDGAHVWSAQRITLGTSAGSSNNVLTVTGTNSYLEVGYGLGGNAGFVIGSIGANNTVIISNGATMKVDFGDAVNAFRNVSIGSSAGSDNNAVIVTGPGSLMSNTTWAVILGNATKGNRLAVEAGGQFVCSNLFLGNSTTASNNTATVTGPGSVISVVSNLWVGTAGKNNLLLIDNGAECYSSNVLLTASTDNRVQILNGGLLEANLLNVSDSANNITNFGGIFQFTTASPTITKNGSNIVLTNSTVSFRDVAGVDVKGNWTGSQLTNIAFQGNNTFRLNNSSNSTSGQDYIFDTGLGATNYVRLEMVNGNTTWSSSHLTVGSGGSFLASNTVGTVAAAVTNLGSIEVYHSKVTWSSNVVINGKYISDPSTNTYLGDVTVGQSGTLSGGAGDLFDFKKSLFINSTNQIGFQLAKSAVMFSGGGMHTNAITGVDLGSDKALAQYEAFTLQTNFAYGELHLGSATDQICFTCGNIPAIASNGLYVGWLDLLGSASLVTNLHAASGINVYYNLDDTRNNYLNGANYQLTDCNFNVGGGYLIGVPEPSALAMILLGALAFLARRQTK